MKRSLKIGVVIAGYIAALLIASAAVTLRIATTSEPAAQASSGMYAFGDLCLFVGLFGFFSLPPTGAALFFLRPYHRFWKAIAVLGVAAGLTAVIGAILFLLGRHVAFSPLASLAAMSVFRIFIAPLFALAFLICAIFAPLRSVRFAFLAALAMEVFACACGALVWVIFLLQHRP